MVKTFFDGFPKVREIMEKTLSHDHNKNKCGMAFHKNKFAQKKNKHNILLLLLIIINVTPTLRMLFN